NSDYIRKQGVNSGSTFKVNSDYIREQQYYFKWKGESIDTDIKSFVKKKEEHGSKIASTKIDTRDSALRSFSLKLLNKELPTMTTLYTQKPDIYTKPDCSFCEKYKETNTHVFLYSEKGKNLKITFQVTIKKTNLSDALPIRRKHYAASISSVLSDQVLSSNNNNAYSNMWAPSSFGSIDQFFMNPSKRSRSIFSMTSSNYYNNSQVIDPIVQEAMLKEKVKKDLEAFILQLYNDSSLGLYHMSDHIQVDITISDMKDSHEIVESMPKISAFNNISEMMKNTLKILEVAKSNKK
ncbi:2508_t:CDS:2, partial [Diversispora eburnea]